MFTFSQAHTSLKGGPLRVFHLLLAHDLRALVEASHAERGAQELGSFEVIPKAVRIEGVRDAERARGRELRPPAVGELGDSDDAVRGAEICEWTRH